MKLVWIKSGDSIDLEVVDYEIFEFFINQFNHKSLNNFSICSTFNPLKILDDLTNCLIQTNEILKYFHINDLNLPISLDQDEINLLHEKWVILQRKHPMISYLCDKKKENGKINFDGINEYIHELERSFSISISNNMKEPIINNFNKNITSFSFSNVYLNYRNPGRQSYDKWMFFDKSISNIDRNDFFEFFGHINVNLNRTYSIHPYPEYVQWCQEKGINEIYGDKIVLANFKNLEENLTKYRNLFTKNFMDDQNKVTFII